VDQAAAALIGTAIGATIGLLGSGGLWILQGRRDRSVREEAARVEVERERRLQYVEFLTVAREVRYASIRSFERLATRPIEDVDVLLTQLSRAYYTIALTAPADTAALAWTVREYVFDLWRLARNDPPPNGWHTDVRAVRAAVENFREHVRRELNIGAESEADS
jgi:hypothetical protein